MSEAICPDRGCPQPGGSCPGARVCAGLADLSKDIIFALVSCGWPEETVDSPAGFAARQEAYRMLRPHLEAFGPDFHRTTVVRITRSVARRHLRGT